MIPKMTYDSKLKLHKKSLETLILHYQSVAVAPLLLLHDKHKLNFSHTLRATLADALRPMEQS